MRSGLPESTGGFMFCRLWYDASRSMRSGLGWSTDYQAADSNFMTRLEELTPTYIERWENGYQGIAAAELFVDTSAWYPIAVPNHPDHRVLADALTAAVRHGRRVVTTNLIVAETYALLLARTRREAGPGLPPGGPTIT